MLNILIVDDERIILNGISTMITQKLDLPFKIDVVTASNAPQALDILLTFTPNLIITDIRMPVMDGFQFMEQIRKRGFLCDIAVLTSHADFTYAKRAISYQVVDFILKPVEPDVLRETILSSYKRLDASILELQQESLSLLRNILLYDVSPDKLDLNDEIIHSLFPNTYFTTILIEPENLTSDIETQLKTIVSNYYPICHIVSFWQKKQLIAICNHDHFFINTDNLDLQLQKLPGLSPFIYSISISSNTWKGLHSLYMNAQFRILYRKIFAEQSDTAELALFSYKECIQIFTESNSSRISEKVSLYLNRINKQFPITPDYYHKIYNIFFININIYLESIGVSYRFSTEYPLSVNTNRQDFLQYLEHNLLTFQDKYKAATSETMKQTSISILLQYIDIHYMDDISLEDLADIIQMHPNYVCTLFKKQLGQSYLTCLHKKRLEMAKNLLVVSPALTLETIAARVGYNSVNQFLRIFKKFEIITPNEYRNQHQL